MFLRSSCLIAAVLTASTGVSGFSSGEMQERRIASHKLSSQLSDCAEESLDSRRDFFSKVAATAALAGIGSGWLPVMPANAITGLNKVNARLKGFGLPPITKAPDGFAPLLEIYGKGINRFPILVQFNYPVTWVVTTPSNDVNGEDGTVQAGDYAKGDTSTFYVYDEAGSVKDIASAPKSLFEQAIIKAISQKGNNMYQNFKVIKFAPNPSDPDYMLVDFKYELLTGAGFEVDRQGVASVTSKGDAVELLWCCVTRQRFKKMEDTLRTIAGSFRCYTDGLNFSDELVKFEEEKF